MREQSEDVDENGFSTDLHYTHGRSNGTLISTVQV